MVDAFPPVYNVSGKRAVEACLERAAWQRVVFADRLRRSNLLELRPTWECRPIRMHVLRNQPFEFVGSALRPFCSYGDLELEIGLSDYDDSLSSVDIPPEVDIALIWLDFSRYESDEHSIARWLSARLSDLRKVSAVPVLVTDCAPAAEGSFAEALNLVLRNDLDSMPGVYVIDQATCAAQLGESYSDDRLVPVTGSSLSDAACLMTARALGFGWLPALSGQTIRAVIVDLDETLYGGVLGEDGPQELTFDDTHLAIARRLLDLRDRGVFLGLLSRNDPRDVEELFATRPDFGIGSEHFSAVAVGWDSKAKGMRDILEHLRLGAANVLMIDDNLGELASIVNEVPQIHTLWANPSDPGETLRALSLYPGLQVTVPGAADAVRIKDLAASQRRQTELASAGDPAKYLRSLNLVANMTIDDTGTVSRAHELSMKTNQFNLTLSRLSETDLVRRISEPESRVVTGALSDRLSNSGVVFLMVATRRDGKLIVDELAISCRALGRDIETPLVLAALLRVTSELHVSNVQLPFSPGPRNEPVLLWLQTLGCNPTLGVPTLSWNSEEARRQMADGFITVNWVDDVQ